MAWTTDGQHEDDDRVDASYSPVVQMQWAEAINHHVAYRMQGARDETQDNEVIVQFMKELVPEFKSNNSVFEKLDK